MKRRNKKARRLAAFLVTYWVAEACFDLDNDYYLKNMNPADRELVKSYIHRYGYIIGLLLHCRYHPH